MEALLTKLLGKQMWTCRRAADMATFQFGDRKQVRDYYGRPAEVGEYAVHVQCPWRIVREGNVVVGRSDLNYPETYADGQTIPEGFDWDRTPNRRDALLRQFFQDAGPLVVTRVLAADGGACHIEFDENTRLEIFPDDSLRHEHWRVFSTEGPETLVVGSGQERGGSSD